MRWFADEDTADREPLQVFIEPRGEGTSIDLEVQANVIEHSADYADARFIDTRDEALIVDEEGVAAVRDEGILIRIGPVVEEGDTVSLDVDQFVDSETQRSLRFELVAVDGEWRMRGEPTVVDPA